MYQQIVNPDTKRLVYVHGQTYNNLQKKYGEGWISKQPRHMTTKIPKSPQIIKKYKTLKSYNLPSDMWHIILLDLDINK